MDHQKNELSSNDDADHLWAIFIHQLNLAYCGLSHLSERLEEISTVDTLEEIKEMLPSLYSVAEQKIKLMDQIYLAIGTGHEFTGCAELVEYLERMYNDIQWTGRSSVDITKHLLLSFLKVIDAIETASLDLLKYVALIVHGQTVNQLLQDLALSKKLL